MFMSEDSPESFVPREQLIQRRERSDIRGLERTAFALPYERPEPFPQAPRLSRQTIQLAGHGARAHCTEYVGGHQARLPEPAQKALAIVDPIDRDVDGCGHRIQEIQAKRVGNERRGNFLGQLGPLAKKITCLLALDKLCRRS